MAANGTTLVATGNGIYVSTDTGISWTPRVATPSFSYPIFNGDHFSALSFELLATSTNGMDWVTTPSPSAPSVLQSVTFGNGVYVAVGQQGDNWKTYSSSDELTWTAFSGAVPTVGLNSSVAFGNGVFALTSIDGANHDGTPIYGFIATSTNGTNWTGSTPNIDVGTAGHDAIRFTGGHFFVPLSGLGDSTGFLVSSDGTNWVEDPMLWYSQSMVVFGGNHYVYASHTGDFATGAAL